MLFSVILPYSLHHWVFFVIGRILLCIVNYNVPHRSTQALGLI